MAKLDIDFVLIDDKVVRYGFRALMTGAELDEFKANPLLLLMHNRPSQYAEHTDVLLPIGKWYDIRVEGDKLLAKPDFDDNDPLAVKVQKKVEGGYMSGASVWIEPIEISEDEKLMLPGQSLPTFTKWGVLEASIVDIPNCKNALAIRNSMTGKRIQLSDTGDGQEVREFLQQKFNKTMDKKFLCLLLGLDESATEEQIKAKLQELKLAHTAAGSKDEELKNLKDQVVSLKLANDTQRNESLVDKAILEGKIMKGEREDYLKLAAADFDTTSKLLGKIEAQKTIESQFQKTAGGNSAEVEELMKLSGRDLYMNGKLERLQQISPEHFKLKYKEAFGVEYKA